MANTLRNDISHVGASRVSYGHHFESRRRDGNRGTATYRSGRHSLKLVPSGAVRARCRQTATAMREWPCFRTFLVARVGNPCGVGTAWLGPSETSIRPHSGGCVLRMRVVQIGIAHWRSAAPSHLESLGVVSTASGAEWKRINGWPGPDSMPAVPRLPRALG